MILLGGTSQLGYSIVRRFGLDTLTPFCSEYSRYEECQTWPRVNLDDADGLRRVIDEWQPKLLLHCAGICDVEKCEKEPEFARAVNVKSMDVLLNSLPDSTRLVYCSSDHVFGGDRGPYCESDPTHPISIYGQTRCEAEEKLLRRRPSSLIIRHGLGIGPSISGRTGHLDWLRYRTQNRLPITVISDEVRSAVWAADLAERVWSLADSDITGIRHVTATTSGTRVELAQFLSHEYDIGATLNIASRHQQAFPHIGDVELATEFLDPLYRPLEAVSSRTTVP
ncbi:MAG: sugar nucleotide-binding protein [Acidobacteriota bacterium]|nr:sugar nucleotide-binding protein [Acidobacteriota bacterium]MDH3784885.1 sugar nucleotide-binding protein [Acidobacteriota bacterium]